MSFKPFKQIRLAPNVTVTDKNINDVQNNIAQCLNQITNKDQLDSVIIKNIVLFPGVVNNVSHNLSRTLQGWYVVRTHGSYNQVWDNQDANPSPNLTVWLLTPIQVTVDLLCF